MTIYIYILSIYFQHNSGTPGAILTKLGTHMTIYIYIYLFIYLLSVYIIYIKMYVCVCMYVCSSINYLSVDGCMSVYVFQHKLSFSECDSFISLF
jgi:hypothetical protein